MDVTPPIERCLSVHLSEDPFFFRKLGDRGLITVTEYLFLPSLLSRPKSGHR